MKRTLIRIVSLGLMLALCAGASAQDADDLSYTMSEKLMKQLDAGSGFIGTLDAQRHRCGGARNRCVLHREAAGAGLDVYQIGRR